MKTRTKVIALLLAAFTVLAVPAEAAVRVYFDTYCSLYVYDPAKTSGSVGVYGSASASCGEQMQSIQLTVRVSNNGAYVGVPRIFSCSHCSLTGLQTSYAYGPWADGHQWHTWANLTYQRYGETFQRKIGTNTAPKRSKNCPVYSW